jgi:dethiobiotin synthetase
MPKQFFVTGTDTGVGKTVVSALLCAGMEAVYWKPIQTGTRDGTDTKTVLQLAKLDPPRIVPETYRFAPPVSPHLAAELAGVRIEMGRFRVPRTVKSENLIVEGAGGVLVPINERYLMVDLMKRLKLPVILVSRTSLGTINHTLLSLAALRSAKIAVRGVVLVGKENRENRRAIDEYGEQYGHVKVIGWVPLLRKIDRAALLRIFHNEFDRRALSE